MTLPLDAADTRLLSTVDALPDEDWSGPSHCVGWSRAHVIAHIALNAEALTGVLRGFRDGTPATMYLSDEIRDQDIDTLAAASPDEVRARLRAALAAFAEVASVADGLDPQSTFERTPGGRLVAAAPIPVRRLREVEVHHADLATAYTWADWPAENAAAFLTLDAGVHHGAAFHLAATDHDGRWAFGDAGPNSPTVSGPVAALSWWVTGRDPGSVLSSTNGPLPTME